MAAGDGAGGQPSTSRRRGWRPAAGRCRGTFATRTYPWANLAGQSGQPGSSCAARRRRTDHPTGAGGPIQVTLRPSLVAVDWGTSRFRAWLLDAAGAVLAETASDDGIMAVAPGQFPATLQRLVGPWLAAYPGLPVACAGMVGSQNGWVEAPYLSCPVTVDGLAGSLMAAGGGDGLSVLIVPGVSTRDANGMPDVMRGEEVKIVGCGAGLTATVVTPGTHAKWSRVVGGCIQSFTTFMTGDVFAAVRDHTILSRLRATPADPAGFGAGLALAAAPGGLTHKLFAARTRVLAGEMPGNQVEPFLSGLLIGTEVAEGVATLAADEAIVLVADGIVAQGYAEAFASHGRTAQVIAPDIAFMDGLRTLVAARR